MQYILFRTKIETKSLACFIYVVLFLRLILVKKINSWRINWAYLVEKKMDVAMSILLSRLQISDGSVWLGTNGVYANVSKSVQSESQTRWRKTHWLIYYEHKCAESLLLFVPKFNWNWGAQSKRPAHHLAKCRFYRFALCIPGFSPVASALRSKLFEPFCSLKFNEWVSGYPVWDSVPTRLELSIGVWLDWFQNFGIDPIIIIFNIKELQDSTTI